MPQFANTLGITFGGQVGDWGELGWAAAAAAVCDCVYVCVRNSVSA